LVNLQIEQTIAASVKSNVEQYLQTVNLDQLIAETLEKQISNVILNLTTRILGDIVSKRDLQSEVTSLVKNILADQLLTFGTNQVTTTVQSADINSLIVSSVKNEVHRVASSYEFPEASIPFGSINLEKAIIPGSKIDTGKIKVFNSTGIEDQSSTTQLVITDEGIITKNNITAANLLVDDNTFLKNVTIEGNLILDGTISSSETLDRYINAIANKSAVEIVDRNNKNNIDLADRSITCQDRIILSETTLGPQIINSNLRKVGNLSDLVVSGQASISGTLTVTDKRVGINTEEARGALTVWDEDSEFTLIKKSPKNMFAGSTRVSDVTFGSNSQEQIRLKTNGDIEINGRIRLSGLLISAVDKIPERVGEPGEIAILIDGSAIYRCHGQTSWGKIL
jgi:hypothetical protein